MHLDLEDRVVVVTGAGRGIGRVIAETFVNSSAPGMIPTAMNGLAKMPESTQNQLLDTLSLRHWGEPRDVADLICFLAGDIAGCITGTFVDVSGDNLATQIPRRAYELAGRS